LIVKARVAHVQLGQTVQLLEIDEYRAEQRRITCHVQIFQVLQRPLAKTSDYVVDHHTTRTHAIIRRIAASVGGICVASNEFSIDNGRIVCIRGQKLNVIDNQLVDSMLFQHRLVSFSTQMRIANVNTTQTRLLAVEKAKCQVV
jgi:hypothetical protein